MLPGRAYSFGEELFIDLQQIIPTAEAADYVIRVAAKESEAQSVEGARKRSERLRHDFWTRALEELRARDVSRFEKFSPSKEHWLSCGTGVTGCNYALIMLKNEVRSELYLQRSRPAENKCCSIGLPRRGRTRRPVGADPLMRLAERRQAGSLLASSRLDANTGRK